MKATAEAHPNIAVVKYWGKRDESLNLPQNGSISLTLAPLATRTTVELLPGLSSDQVILNGTPAPPETTTRVGRFLDLFRTRAAVGLRARVTTHNDFPTAAGVASSSSAFAALAVAAAEALELSFSRQELSILARQGSGSSCRSIHGGFVEWKRGVRPDGTDSFAVPLAPARHWDLRIVLAIVDQDRKPIGSRDAMRRTVLTSPLYPGWLERASSDLPRAREAIRTRDLTLLGPVAERNAMAMFGAMLGADPPVRYWLPATLAVMQALEALRSRGHHVYFTLDAGPNVKALCLEPDVEPVCGVLRKLAGVEQVLSCHMGGPPRRIE